MDEKRSLCNLCQGLWSPQNFNQHDHLGEVTVHEFLRSDFLPELPVLVKATADGCLFCAILLREVSSHDWPPEIQEVRIGPATLVHESYYEGKLSDDQEGVLAIKISVTTAKETGIMLWFDVFAESSSQAKETLRIRRQPPFIDRTSDACISRIQDWLSQCIENHRYCERNFESFAPSRLIDVGPKDSSVEPRLVESSRGIDCSKYVALSHCWGPARPGVQMLKTEESTLAARMHQIPLESMPNNFRDAVAMTRALGLRYIWIDSLCIIQDSNDDWARESAQMDKIYKYALLTLAATSVSTCHDGFLSYPFTKQRFRVPAHAPTKLHHNADVILQSMKDQDGIRWMTEIDGSVWNSRGWTLQERFLSRRILHFASSQMYWECQRGVKTECGQRVVSFSFSSSRMYGFQDPNVEASPASSNTDNEESESQGSVSESTLSTDKSVDIGALYNWWFQIIADYSNRKLTYTSDKLPAIAGLAAEMSSIVKLHGSSSNAYIAGIWTWNLAPCLLWRPQKASSVTCPKPYRAPTWSWAHWDVAVIPSFEGISIPEDHEGTVKYVSHDIQHTTTNLFGSIRHASLSLRAKMRRVSLSRGVSFPRVPYVDRSWNLNMKLVMKSRHITPATLPQPL